jgi:hypothetical protein
LNALKANCRFAELAAYLSWQDSRDPAGEPLQPADVA